MKKEIFNAIIKDAKLFLDGQYLTYKLEICWDGGGVDFGSHVLSIDGKSSNATDGAGKFIMEILKTVGVTSWEDLQGKYIRVLLDAPARSVIGFGHIIEEKWLIPVEFYKSLSVSVDKERELKDILFEIEPIYNRVESGGEPSLYNLLIKYYGEHFDNPEYYATRYIQKLKELYVASL